MKILRKLVPSLTIILLGSTFALAQSSWDNGWTAPKESMLSRRSAEAADESTQMPDADGRNDAINEPIYSNDTEIDSIIEQVLNSRREGRNLGEYDKIYADGNIDQALQQGNDMQARNLIRDKLCGLGLMSCDVEEKRPYYSTIYAQGPPQQNFGGGPYGPPKPMPPPNHFNSRPYGPPKPPPNHFNSRPPPPPQNSFGPPRKVGYELPFNPNYRPLGPGPNYNGPYLESPPPSTIENGGGITFSKPPPGAVIYGSKPPGPVFQGNPNGSPYEYENPIVDKIEPAGSQQNNFYSHHGASVSSSPSGSKFVVGAIPPGVSNPEIPASGLQQHVHHHFHHVEDADATKVPTVPIPIGGNQAVNTDFASLAQSSTAFVPQPQGAFSQSPAYAAGFNSASQGGLLSKPFKPSTELYKPTGGLNSFGSNSFQQEAGLNQFGNSGFDQVSGSYHTQNPDYYKKELQNFGGLGSASNFNNIDNGYGGSQYQGDYDTARQQLVDCQCVPFNQCPAADRIGRKEDLILPIDPRNLGKDIEAISEDATNSTSTASPETKEESETTETNQNKDDTESKRSKRQAQADAKQDDPLLPLDNEGFRQGLAALQVFELVKRKVLPTYGVSFGLPYPGPGAYPVNPQGDFYPAQNPHFGSIGPNGLSLGPLNVNPLVSVQVSKTEYGNKVVKPYVNLHVTPNANLIQSFKDWFKKKPEVLHNSHYHHHDHYTHGYGHGSPIVHHGFSDGPEFVHGSPIVHHGFSNGPPHHSIIETVPSSQIFEYHGPSGGPPVFSKFHHANHHFESSLFSTYSENGPNVYPGFVETPADSFSSMLLTNGYDELHGVHDFSGTNLGVQQNGFDNFYERSSNISTSQYAPEVSKYKEFPIESSRHGKKLHLSSSKPIPTPAPGFSEGSPYVTFPNNRRRRDVVKHEGADEHRESILRSYIHAEQRAYYGNRPVEKTCRTNEVCCRRPLRPQQQQQQQLGRCGTRNAAGITGRIKNPVYVDGDSEFGEYPWHVAILKKDPKESIYACGGTLIDAQHVLTAAHCIKSQNGFDLRARLGEWDVNHDVEFFPYIERDIVSVQIHPEYYAGTLDNDLAVLKLDFPVDFSKNPHISPACLPDKFSDYTGARCWTTGWGKDAFGQQGKYQNILKEVDVPILSHHQCESQLRQTRLGYSYKLNPGFVCAGGEEGKDACKGDGGGPLVCERNGVWNVVGVVSWGIGCGQTNVPGVYVRVAHYLDWINQITQYYK